MRHLKSLLALTALAVTAGLHAQSANVAITDPSTTMTPSWFRSDIEAVYGFRLKTTGVNVDAGASIAPGNFIGLEYTYFHPTDSSNDAVNGTINSKETINILGATYRYSCPIGRFNDDWKGIPLRLYLGGGAGLADVKYNSSVPRYTYYTSDKDNDVFAWDASAGLEYWLTPNVGVKAGFRYVYLYHVVLYSQRGNIDTGAVEGGLTFRW